MDTAEQLKRAEEELLKLEQEKLAIERRMHGWVQVIQGLRLLSEKFDAVGTPTVDEIAAEMETPSLPTKILTVLASINQPIGATQIRDQLIANGEADPSTKNLLINIHTTLKRLIPDQVEEVVLDDKSKLYRYRTPMERAVKGGVFMGRRMVFDHAMRTTRKSERGVDKAKKPAVEADTPDVPKLPPKSVK